MKKRSALILSFLGVLVFLVSMYSVSFKICGDANYDCRKTADLVQMIFSICVPLFLLSLITYKLSEQVFQVWWKVAMWFVPIIIVVTFFTNYGHQQSGFGGVAQGAFSFAFVFLLYAAFILTALIRIILAYRKLKQGNV